MASGGQACSAYRCPACHVRAYSCCPAGSTTCPVAHSTTPCCYSYTRSPSQAPCAMRHTGIRWFGYRRLQPASRRCLVPAARLTTPAGCARPAAAPRPSSRPALTRAALHTKRYCLAGRPARGLARLGPGRADRSTDGRRHHGPVGPSGRGGRSRPIRAKHHNLDRHGVGQIARLPAARTGWHPGRRHRSLSRAYEGTGRRSAEADPLTRPGPGQGRCSRRRHAMDGADQGPVACELPADHAGHAAPVAAAQPFPVERVPPATAVRHRR